MIKLHRFMWWCAGAHIEILEKYPTEWGKYFGIGGTIIFTALMASFAGGYAFFTAFKSIPLACAFGIFWGALIFNLDRYIVSSIGKGDGTAKITKEEFQNSIPRLILAILIGFVVSTPLELKVFEREIEVEIQEIINEKRQKMVGGLNDLRGEQQRLKDRIQELRNSEKEVSIDIKGNDPRIEVSNQNIVSLRQEESSIQKRIDNSKKKQQNLSTEILGLEGRSASTDVSAYSRKQNQLKILETEANSLQQRILDIRKKITGENNSITIVKNDLSKDYDTLKTQNNNTIETINKQITDLDTIYQNKAKGFKNQSEKYNGFMARLEALERLSLSSDTIYALVSTSPILNTSITQIPTYPQRQMTGIKKEYTVVWYAKWMIALLLIAIEIAPILFKMMTESGPYDDRVEEIKYASEVEKKLFVSNINQKTNIDLKISNQLNEQKLEAELKVNQELLQKIAASQSEIIYTAIEKWKEEELRKARDNPNYYINSEADTISS